MLCILRPHPLVFSLLRQNLQVLQEDNSCHTFEYCANFSRCLTNMPIVLFMLFLSYVRGRKFLFCVCDVSGSNSHLCASLQVAFHMEKLCTLVRTLRKYLGGGRWNVQVGERHEKGGKSAIDGGGGQGLRFFFWILGVF